MCVPPSNQNIGSRPFLESELKDLRWEGGLEFTVLRREDADQVRAGLQAGECRLGGLHADRTPRFSAVRAVLDRVFLGVFPRIGFRGGVGPVERDGIRRRGRHAEVRRRKVRRLRRLDVRFREC